MRRRSLRRTRRYLQRYWPLFLAVALVLGIVLVGRYGFPTLQFRTAQPPAPADSGLDLVNRSGQTAQAVEVRVWWPENALEARFVVRDLRAGATHHQRLWVPAGSRLQVKVTLADGKTTSQELVTAVEAIGSVAVYIHEGGKATL